MNTPKLFQYAVLWHPTEKQKKDDGLVSKIIVSPQTILAADMNKANMAAVMAIPSEHKDQLEQIEVVVCPF